MSRSRFPLRIRHTGRLCQVITFFTLLFAVPRVKQLRLRDNIKRVKNLLPSMMIKDGDGEDCELFPLRRKLKIDHHLSFFFFSFFFLHPPKKYTHTREICFSLVLSVKFGVSCFFLIGEETFVFSN